VQRQVGELGGEIAVSHVHSRPSPRERLTQRILEADHAGVTHGRTRRLDHAAELWTAVGEVTEEHVTVDIGARALERAAEARTEPS